MPKMKKDDAIRASMLRDGEIKSGGPIRLNGLSREQSQAAAIAARRDELAPRKVVAK
jgi:hypothetical protein